MATPATPHDFLHQFNEALGKKTASTVANAPTADKVLGQFKITDPNPAREKKYAGDHTAVVDDHLHTRAEAAKTAAKDYETHANTPAASITDQAAHNVELAKRKTQMEQAGLDAHSHLDLTHEALNQRMEAVSEAQANALAALEKNAKDLKMSPEDVAKARESIEAAAKLETQKINAAGTALHGAREEVSKVSGVASKWEKAAATEIAAAEKQATFLGSKMLGGVKTGITANFAQGWKGKAQVAVGGVMMVDAGRRLIQDIGGMMGKPGVGKDGETLPSPGIMNLAFDAGEGVLGAVIASKNVFRGAGR